MNQSSANRSLVVACDVASQQDLRTLVAATGELEFISGFKIGAMLALSVGLSISPRLRLSAVITATINLRLRLPQHPPHRHRKQWKNPMLKSWPNLRHRVRVKR